MSAVHSALAKRYPSPEYATVFEVSNATGFRGTNFADAVVMSCWPSRGIWLAGVEIKVSRSDWLREKKSVEKSVAIQKFCDYWWLAVSDADLVKDGELPETWGMLALRGDKLVTVKEAPKLEPEPMTRSFIASMMRNAQKGYVPQAEVERLAGERAEKIAEGRRDENAYRAKNYEKVDREREQLAARIEAFEAASGIDIGRWEWSATPEDAKRMGAVVRALREGGVCARSLASMRASAERALASIREVEKGRDEVLASLDTKAGAA